MWGTGLCVAVASGVGTSDNCSRVSFPPYDDSVIVGASSCRGVTAVGTGVGYSCSITVAVSIVISFLKENRESRGRSELRFSRMCFVGSNGAITDEHLARFLGNSDVLLSWQAQAERANPFVIRSKNHN